VLFDHLHQQVTGNVRIAPEDSLFKPRESFLALGFGFQARGNPRSPSFIESRHCIKCFARYTRRIRAAFQRVKQVQGVTTRRRTRLLVYDKSDPGGRVE